MLGIWNNFVFLGRSSCQPEMLIKRARVSEANDFFRNIRLQPRRNGRGIFVVEDPHIIGHHFEPRTQHEIGRELSLNLAEKLHNYNLGT